MWRCAEKSGPAGRNIKAARLRRQAPCGSLTSGVNGLWLRAVVRMDPSSPRASRYVAAYNVAGTFHATIDRAWHFRD